ncbi:MAG: hypothetical protein ACHQ1D_00855 [Nitrososphaerales archaeon]
MVISCDYNQFINITKVVNNFPIWYTDSGSLYTLWAGINSIFWSCRLDRNSPAEAESLLDFETNYKSGANTAYVPPSVGSVTLALPTDFSVKQVTVTTTASRIDSPVNPNRKRLRIKFVVGSGPAYIGRDNTVTASTGWEISNDEVLILDVSQTVQVWAIDAGGSTTFSVIEEF